MWLSTHSRDFNLVQKKLQAKLGADWKLTIDFATIGELTGENSKSDRAKSERQYLPDVLFNRYCATIADEINKWDSDTVEAVNDAVKDHELVITMDRQVIDVRYTVRVTSKIEVAIQQDKICFTYPYDDKTSITGVIQSTL